MLKNKADVHMMKREGFTPLYAASMQGHTAIVQLLILYKAIIYQAADAGETPILILLQKMDRVAVEKQGES